MCDDIPNRKLGRPHSVYQDLSDSSRAFLLTMYRQ